MDINNASKAIIHYDFRYDNEINGNYPPKIQNVYLSDIKTKGTISCADVVNVLGFSYGTMASHYLKNIELNVSGNAYTIYGGKNGENLITDFSKLGFNYKNVLSFKTNIVVNPIFNVGTIISTSDVRFFWSSRTRERSSQNSINLFLQFII